MQVGTRMTSELILRGVGSRLTSAFFLVLLAAVLFCQRQALGQPALSERVLVVYNSSASESLAVAKHYMALRQIPEHNLCKISVGAVDYIKQDEFESRVK